MIAPVNFALRDQKSQLPKNMDQNNIILKISNLHWLATGKEVLDDLCAHGSVEFAVNNTTFLTPPDNDLTVSATALFLLRTLEKSHTPSASVCEHNMLFAHCGHSMWYDDGNFSLTGCNKWFDPQVLRHADLITITGGSGQEETVTAEEWKNAVYAFADEVKAFYAKANQKNIPKENFEKAGYEFFWKEWEMMRTNSKVKPL